MADVSGLKAKIDELGFLPTSSGNTYKCTVREKRQTMNDGEFWADVFGMPDPLQEALELDECFGIEAPNPCPECGSIVACGYDSEGRPMIHVIEEGSEA